MTDLPFDICIQIAQQLFIRRDLLNLSQTCYLVRSTAVPLIFETATFDALGKHQQRIGKFVSHRCVMQEHGLRSMGTTRLFFRPCDVCGLYWSPINNHIFMRFMVDENEVKVFDTRFARYVNKNQYFDGLSRSLREPFNTQLAPMYRELADLIDKAPNLGPVNILETRAERLGSPHRSSRNSLYPGSDESCDFRESRVEELYSRRGFFSSSLRVYRYLTELGQYSRLLSNRCLLYIPEDPYFLTGYRPFFPREIITRGNLLNSTPGQFSSRRSDRQQCLFNLLERAPLDLFPPPNRLRYHHTPPNPHPQNLPRMSQKTGTTTSGLQAPVPKRRNTPDPGDPIAILASKGINRDNYTDPAALATVMEQWGDFSYRGQEDPKPYRGYGQQTSGHRQTHASNIQEHRQIRKCNQNRPTKHNTGNQRLNLPRLEVATQLRTAPPEGNQGTPGNIPGVAQDALEAMQAAASDPRRHQPRLGQPKDFDGARKEGNSFLNSYKLNFHICLEDFAEKQAHIHWALSFIKTG
ncbi:hypothetical protein M422DRAFT_264736 [Sphaerobolus stellatus SS14]|uniref:F-box domain-containing protein n=1 Tax=Sphaerobolus stellatus (strain SS14) TaxID=990650 RepID=A0A0C9V7L9_SPHS4|nr:hypothetical protein M422DRAFT_264736 [Sphaerobolus stellatus SS14]